jgi:hypothetical protein
MKKVDKSPAWHFKVAKSLIMDGTVKTIPELFYYVSKSGFAKSLNMNYNTFLARIEKPSNFKLGELIELADLIEVDVMVLIRMVIQPNNDLS